MNDRAPAGDKWLNDVSVNPDRFQIPVEARYLEHRLVTLSRERLKVKIVPNNREKMRHAKRVTPIFGETPFLILKPYPRHVKHGLMRPGLLLLNFAVDKGRKVINLFMSFTLE